MTKRENKTADSKPGDSKPADSKPADSKPGEAPQRRPGLRALAQSVPRVTAASGMKRGFGQAALFSRWSDIVGAMLAESSLPERLIFPRGQRHDGTLHIRVEGPLALELQHLEPIVVERINSFFGYHAVARLALRQGPLPRPNVRRPKPPVPSLTAAQERDISARVAAVADPDLRERLAELGRSLAAKARNPAASPPARPTGKKP
ncbi:MAG: DUF721 domain-containing protein [Alphaproteobacteria bacterium]|nr:DUF721 domain-containing protein [Alphaproteobacteria bacterium]